MEEVVAEKAHHIRDADALEVVIEAAGLLTYSQLEGLGVPTTQAVLCPLAAGPS